MLGGEREDDGTVTRCGVGVRACFMAGEKNFADAPVFETRDGGAVTEPAHLEVEGFGSAPVWQALAHECGPAGKSAAAGLFS
jgi:hypothetical protein